MKRELTHTRCDDDSRAERTLEIKRRTIAHLTEMRVRSAISSEWTYSANRLDSVGICPADAKDHGHRNSDFELV